MLEQTKFTYSPLGKDFEKQIKTIEEQEERQIKIIHNQGQIKTIKKMIIVITIVHWFQRKKKYLMNFLIKGLRK